MPIQSGVTAVALGLASAAAWGAGDFSGGFATKRANLFGVVVVSQIAGLILIGLVAVVSHDPIPPPGDWLWGAVAGIVGGLGLLAFYQALATGQMGIAAPVSGVCAALLPVVFAALTQGVPPATQLLGFALGLTGVWLLARPETHPETSGQAASVQRVHSNGLGLAIFAGLSFGGFLVLIHQASGVSAFWPLLGARAGSLLIITGVALTTQRKWLPSMQLVPFLILAGALDLGGNVFFVLAGQAGRLDVAGVLSSLYPGTTVILAVIVLRERISRGRLIGIAVALLAVVLIALPYAGK